MTLVIFAILFLMGLVGCSGGESSPQFSPRESCSIEEEIVSDDRQLIANRQKPPGPGEKPVPNPQEEDKRYNYNPGY